MSGNGWLQMIAENPGHSEWYIERFRTMAASGHDLGGEARFIDAIAPRRARILDAGCGPGRVGGRLAALGHDVVGVDIDPALIAAAASDHPSVNWLVRDLATLDLAADGITERFDVIVSAGNVMTFLDPLTRRDVLHRLAAHLAPNARLVVGFGSDRGYPFDEFFADAEAVGLCSELTLSSWDLHPFDQRSTFLVATFTVAEHPA
jgi:2-polyprenyl-3-methyl-5-hydroxy-6-metoxy-1,4-benzoquinol methylase